MAQENDMSNPDWTAAPNDATHWDIRGAVWCKRLYFWCYGRWNYMGEIHDLAEDRYTPRPVEPATTAWDGTGFPPVGTVCEVNFCDVWVRATIEHLLTWKGGTACIFKTEEDWDFSSCLDCFRPIPTQAQIDRTQLVKTLNQLRGETDMGVIADAIIEMGFGVTKS